MVSVPSKFVRCDSEFVQIVFNFAVILSSTHRAHGCEKHRLPVLSEAFPLGISPRLIMESVPDVVDVLGKVVRQQYIVLQ